MGHVPKSSQNEIQTLRGVGRKESPSRDSQVPPEAAANGILLLVPLLCLGCSVMGRTILLPKPGL